MLRLSVTALESFRYWKGREEATIDDLRADLTYSSPKTPQMEAGGAMARALEDAQAGDLGIVERDGWTFDFSGLDAEMALPETRELKGTALFATPSGPVTLSAKADAVGGIICRDAKLTERWDAEKYIDSLQWRSYCLVFGSPVFVYDIFVGRYKGRRVEVVEYHPLRFYTYPDVRRDVERAVAELAAVVREHGIIPETQP